MCLCCGKLVFIPPLLPTLKAAPSRLIKANRNSAIVMTELCTTLSFAPKGAFVSTASTHSLTAEVKEERERWRQRKQAILYNANSIMTSHGEKTNMANVWSSAATAARLPPIALLQEVPNSFMNLLSSSESTWCFSENFIFSRVRNEPVDRPNNTQNVCFLFVIWYLIIL